MLHAVPGKAGDPRLGSLVVPFDAKPIDKLAVGFVWFPFDEGTLRNSGRGGARDSPGAVAQLLSKFGTAINPEEGIDLGSRICLVNVGSAQGETLEDAHASLTSLTLKTLSADMFPIIVGGSNDQSYCNASAWLSHNKAAQSGTVINIDAHFDVRPPLDDGRRHSGSPFWDLIEDKRFSGRLVEFAAQGHQCSQVHADYITNHGGTIKWLGELRKATGGPQAVFSTLLKDTPGPIFLSFDVDAICARDMPGVSCPGSIGLSAEEAVSIARTAGANPKVEMLDLSELNVAIEGDRSARLVACIIYNFLLGLAERDSPSDSCKKSSFEGLHRDSPF